MPEEHGAEKAQEAAQQSGHEGATGQTESAQGAEKTRTPGETPVTASTLQSILARQDRTYQDNLKRTLEAQQKALEATFAAKLDEVLAKATPPAKGDGGKAGTGDNAAAILALEKKNKELEEAFKASEKARSDIAEKDKEFRFRTKVEAALARNKCNNTQAAYAVLRDMNILSFDPESEKITAKVKDTQSGFNLGEVDVDIDTYIKGTFSEDLLPQLFDGKVRPGAPAGGDSGGGSRNGKFQYKQSDLEGMSHEQYLKERDKIEEARRTNRIQMGV